MALPMYRSVFLLTAALPTVLVGAPALSQTLVSDNFESDSSSDYIVVDDATPDGTLEFAFDYASLGIPAAPRSEPGDTRGLRLTANNSLGIADAVTVFHQTAVFENHYRLTVDVWLNFVLGSTGTTEHAHVGVGGDGTTFNQLFLPISGSGAYIAFDGDGDSGSDYRWFRDAANTPPGDSDSTTLPNSHPSYLGRGSDNSGPFFLSLFPSPPATIAGSPGNQWTTVAIDVDNRFGIITFYFDDELTFQGAFAGRFDGLVSLGLADVFSSQADPANQFLVYDNLDVRAVSGQVGSNYCQANSNSTGATGVISAFGSRTVTFNDLLLRATDLPLNAFGFFITSRNQGFVPNPAGSEGILCLSGQIGRYVAPGQIQSTGAEGSFELALDLTQTPTPTGIVSIAAGQTWNWQAWHRDTSGGSATSNFTDGVSVDFQ